MTKTQVRQHLGFLGFDALTASKSSPARLIDSDNIRQIVSTIWVYMQAEQLELLTQIDYRKPRTAHAEKAKRL